LAAQLREVAMQTSGGDGGQGRSSTGLDANIAGALCYFGLFVTGIFFLVVEKHSDFVRFHAMQSTLVFVGLFVLSFVVRIVPLLGGLVSALLYLSIIVVWVLGMLKAFQSERYKLPIVGDLAERQLANP
jgi:uncharacterized membrane protein